MIGQEGAEHGKKGGQPTYARMLAEREKRGQ